ncbi:TCP-1/cpn60 chaperonin family protein [Streptomyces sp. NPDC051211]|uniref:caspase, EACC1-associated type n=1 Tax=Streptomyces sp. NPDC051211 TaxID=3154643 RepID=UPI00344E2AAB
MTVREALVIGTSTYEDSRLNRLRSPGLDAMELSEVLSDRGIGGYAVRPVIDQPAHVVRREIERFFTRRKPDDQLLLYLSCHGIKDSKLQLYFAAADTDRDLLDSTSVSAGFVNAQLVRCNSRKILVLLDCCYSGAFRPGGSKTADTSVHLLEEFKDTGVAVITATDALQQAWEGDDTVTETGEGQLSVFTAAAVEGLRSGRADRDGDGWISVEDLYGHVREEMLARDARQNPLRWVLGGQGTLKIARRAAAPGGGAQPLSLPRSMPALAGPAAEVLSGITAAASLLRRTLGPLPRPVLLNRADGTAYTSTDTREIVAALPEDGPGFSAIGTRLVRELVADQDRRAGDGTASAVVVFGAVVRSLQAALARGEHPAALSRAVPEVFEAARSALDAQPRPLAYADRLDRALISAAGDEETGRIVARAMERTQGSGLIHLGVSAGFGLELQTARACVVDSGYLSPQFATDQEAERAVLDEPRVVVCIEPLERVEDLLPLLEKVVATDNRPLLVVAPSVGGDVLPTLAVNTTKETLRSVALAVPGTDDLDAVAEFTGCKWRMQARDVRQAVPGELGRAAHVISTRGSTALIGDEQAGPGRLQRSKAGRTLAKALGAGLPPRPQTAHTAARILVGGATEAVRAQRTALADRAVRIALATRLVGVLPGAAAALAVAGNRIPGTGSSAAAEALRKALAEPLRALAENYGEADPAAVVDRVRAEWPTSVYDAARGRYLPASAVEVWDPAAAPGELLRSVETAVLGYLAVV